MQNQVQNPPTAAYVLSLLGGIIGLIVSLILVALGVLAFTAMNAFSEYSVYYDYSAVNIFWVLYIGLGLWCLISSVMILKYAGNLKANPLEHSKYGVRILIFSIIGVGGLLGLIGGILAMTYKPIMVGAQPQYGQPQYGAPPVYGQPYAGPQPTTRACPQCGRVVQDNVRFCPNCGRQLY
jgi:hypothetical protein